MLDNQQLLEEVRRWVQISREPDSALSVLVQVLPGRLRKLPPWSQTKAALSALKRELRAWDIREERWK